MMLLTKKYIYSNKTEERKKRKEKKILIINSCYLILFITLDTNTDKVNGKEMLFCQLTC